MPVNEKQISGESLYQRNQYQKGGVGRIYWDYRDRVALSLLNEQDKRIVDLGCGEGITLEKLVKIFPTSEVIGIDYLQENVNICYNHGLKQACKGDIYALDLADKSVDAVVFMEVIEHLEHPEAAIKEIRRILKLNGKLITVFPNDGFFKIARLLTLKFKEAGYDPGHVKQWTQGEMKRFLNQWGFLVFFTRSIPFFLWPISLHGIVGARKLASDFKFLR